VYATLWQTPDERATRRLVEYIHAQGGRINARTLQRSNNRKYPSADDAEEALATLVKDGWGFWEECPTSPHGGRPTRYFRLHPTHDKTDTTPGDSAGATNVPADRVADTTQSNATFSQENRGSVSNVMRRTQATDPDPATGAGESAEGTTVDSGQELPDGTDSEVL
jgi:hypothetical protein